jgi:membrane-bound lytic murein transglycosylase F
MFIPMLLTATESVKKSITVLTRNAPTTFYYGAENQRRGFEFDLVEAFAASYGYEVSYVVKHSVTDVLEALKRGEGDFAAAGLTYTQERGHDFLIGPSYYDIQEQVICAPNKHPKSAEELLKYNIEIIKNSSYLATVKKLREEFPLLKWREHEGYTTEHIFERLSQNKTECTIADSHIIAINRRYYPRLNIAFAVSEEEHLTWMFPKSSASSTLLNDVKTWFKDFEHCKEFHSIKDTYFAHAEIFDYVDLRTFHERIKTILPKYAKLFKEAGKRYGIDWRILAAQSYQESHWNPKAKSPTGVRGMMMLTLPTARQMGIEDRLDPAQSIEGGAKYIARQIKLTSKHVKGKIERIRFALASYNVGRGHIFDAITLGKKLGKNPYVWVNMKKLLPLLAQRKYFKDLKYGYARGHEAVQYVNRINNYFDILRKYYP